MDVERICSLFQSSLDPELQKDAEAALDTIFKIIDFAPSILKVVTNDQVQHATRQAAAIYFKNMITNYWEEKEVKNVDDQLPFAIHENDKIFIRSVIVEAIARSPKLLRNQLSTAFQSICKQDFPTKWSELADQILAKINSKSMEEFSAGLVILYQLCKCYS
ncbi:importin-8-like [Convolutriloba macropyga]|uniref:importin-8-like n=1 Tax=Convolutriloba macropyga TaxID=536237 RepID=UPI003F51AFF4